MTLSRGPRPGRCMAGYGGIAYHKRGTTVCTNAVKLPIEALDRAVLDTLRLEVLRPTALTALMDKVRATLRELSWACCNTFHRHACIRACSAFVIVPPL